MTPLKYQSSKNVNETEIPRVFKYFIQERARDEVNATSGFSKEILVQFQASFYGNAISNSTM